MARKSTRSTRTKKSSSKTSTKKKPTRRRKQSSSQRAEMLKEPIAARVMQAAILVVATLLLFSAIVSPRAGPIMVGALVLVTAFPPIRGPVDLWLTGNRNGKEAERAAAVRMALGAGVIMFTLLNAVTQI